MQHFKLKVPILLSILITSKSLAQETTTTTTENPLQACHKPYSCANCTAARICRPDPNGSGAFIDYKDFNCTGSTPFCHQTTGSCSATPSEHCSVKVIGEHICMKNGVFPHPTTCRKYFQCENYTSTSFNCSSNNYYDANKEQCNYNALCNQVSCSGYNGFKRRYTVSNKVSQLFAYCINSEAAVMDRCDGKYVLNETTQMCEAYCSYPGLIEDLTDCRQYYQCDPTPTEGEFLKTFRRCPDGFGFSQKKFQCVPIEPWCIQSLTFSTTTPVLSVLVSISAESTTLYREVSTTASPQECHKTYSCADCTTARICRPDPNQSGAFINYDIKCTGGTPFCDEKSGSCTRASGCSSQQKVGEFICLRNGKFPYPHSGQKYIECRNYTSYTYNCTGSLDTVSYDVEKEECVNGYRYYSLGNCYGYNGVKRAFSSSQFFSYCINNQIALIDKCDGDYDELDEDSQKCEPPCKFPGLFEDSSDCRKYYKCKPHQKYKYCTQNKYDRTSHYCPDGFGFSQESFQCVPLKYLPWCKQSNTENIKLVNDE